MHLMAPVVLALQCRTGWEKWRLLGWTSRAGDLTGMPELLERRRMRPYIRSDCTGEPPAARFQGPWLLRSGSIPGTGIQIAEHAQKVVPGLLMTTAQAAGFKPLVKALANHFSAGHQQGTREAHKLASQVAGGCWLSAMVSVRQGQHFFSPTRSRLSSRRACSNWAQHAWATWHPSSALSPAGYWLT